MTAPRVRRKLIEVALPLDAINAAAAREKSIRHGHPSTLHLWWARRPLAAARAVIFAQMVDDPSEYTEVLLSDPAKKRAARRALKKRRADDAAAAKEPTTAPSGAPATRDPLCPEAAHDALGTEAATPSPVSDEHQALRDIAAQIERQRLFRLIEELVLWENTTNEKVLERARAEISQSWRRACADNADHPRAKELFDRHKLPAFHDPFAGGGTLPIEAQRLGLESHASDLNPVAVLINKAMIEIPPKFAGQPPVNPESRADRTVVAKTWPGTQGLAEDVRYYGRWMRDEAEKRIAHLYPPVEITPELLRDRPDLQPYEGRKLTVIAWLWARTVKSPNPAFADVDVPLASTFMLSTKKGKEAYVEPVTEGREYRFTVRVGAPPDSHAARSGTKLSRGANFRCLLSGSPITADYIQQQGRGKRIGARLMAIATQGDRGRVYLPPTPEHEATAREAIPEWKPEVEFFAHALGFRVGNYGMSAWSDLFTPRQLVALTTLSELVPDASACLHRAAVAAGLPPDNPPLTDGGTGAAAYAEAVATYLAFALSKQADLGNSLCRWEPIAQCPRQLFGRQAIPMVWDYAEGNPLGDSSGSWLVFVEGIARAFSRTFESVHPGAAGCARPADAGTQSISRDKVVSTDPPYYDNIGYADLSDFFYVWLRRALRPVLPGLFATLTTPKTEELVATPGRHGGADEADAFYVAGMTEAMCRVSDQSHPGFPVTIYYPFKQTEVGTGSTDAGTGWEAFLAAIIRAGLSVSGTWPMRTEDSNHMRGMSSAARASSIVLVCRRLPADALGTTRRQFLSALRSELPRALRLMQGSNVAPVDLAQAAIGSGMAVYTRYTAVLGAAGEPVSVREALALINEVLDEVLTEQEGEFDADSRWALAWFEQHGFDDGDYGLAETLSKAKNTSVSGMVDAGILRSRSGLVRLLRPRELPDYWDPEIDTRLTVWEIAHHLVRVLEIGGEVAAAVVVRKLSDRGELARELCYRLYTLCERKKRAAEALTYNGLVQSWPAISRLAAARGGDQGVLFDDNPEDQS